MTEPAEQLANRVTLVTGRSGVVLAERVGMLADPELALGRMRARLEVAGIE